MSDGKVHTDEGETGNDLYKMLQFPFVSIETPLRNDVWFYIFVSTSGVSNAPFASTIFTKDVHVVTHDYP